MQTFNTISILLAANTTLNGSGSIAMDYDGGHSISAASSSPLYQLTVGANFTILGSGSIGPYVNLNNLGTLKADNSQKILTIKPLASTVSYNAGLISATNRGKVAFVETNLDNTNGLISADALSPLTVSRSTIANGTISTLGTLTVSGSTSGSAFNHVAFSGTMAFSTPSFGATIYPLTITGGSLAGAINQLDGALVALAGSITCDAAWTCNGNSGWPANAYSAVALASDTTLAGTGSLTLGSSSNSLYADNNTSRLTIGPNFTLKGSGNLGKGGSNTKTLAITNLGTILGTALNIGLAPSSTFFNPGLIKSDGRFSSIYVVGAAPNQLLDNTGGTILANNQAGIGFTNTQISGGTLALTNKGQFSFYAGTSIVNATLTLDGPRYQKISGGVAG
jgi:hypothetical protein